MESRIGSTASPRSRHTAPGFRSVVAVGCLSTLVACTGTTEPHSIISIVPKSSSVAIQITPQGPYLNNPITLTNTSAFPISWGACSVSLERNTHPFALPPGKPLWKVVWSPICVATTLLAGSLLQPGETATVQFLVPVSSTSGGGFAGEPGEYRFRLFLGQLIDGQYHSVPADQSLSDAFTIVPST
jgi:hypothetical protein